MIRGEDVDAFVGVSIRPAGLRLIETAAPKKHCHFVPSLETTKFDDRCIVSFLPIKGLSSPEQSTKARKHQGP